MGSHDRKKTFPANVIPDSIKPIPQEKITSILWKFCGWQNPRPEYGRVPQIQCKAENPWTTLLTPDREPAEGYSDEADPAITLSHIQQCIEGKFNVLGYQVEMAHEWTQRQWMPSYRQPLDNPLIMRHCADNHPADSPIKFFVSWWDVCAYRHMWTEDTFWQELIAGGTRWKKEHVINSQRVFIRDCATSWMGRDSYFQAKGKPVFTRGAAENLEFYEEHFDLTPKEIVDIWREEVWKIRQKDLYIVGTAVAEDARPKLKGWGFDCISNYLVNGKGWDDAIGNHRYWWARLFKEARQWGLDCWIPASAGYDGRAWRTPESEMGFMHMPTAAQFTEHIKEVRSLTYANDNLTGSIYTVYAGGEHGEGGNVLKMKPHMLHDGDEMIRAHAKAAT